MTIAAVWMNCPPPHGTAVIGSLYSATLPRAIKRNLSDVMLKQNSEPEIPTSWFAIAAELIAHLATGPVATQKR